MERLKIVLLIAAVVATAQTSTAQQQQQQQQQVGVPAARTSSPSTQATFVVIGDVQNCDEFPISAEKKVTIRDAAAAAGLPDGPVSVSVIRGTQERALWTQTLSPTSSDSGEAVLSGDILVVQAMQSMASPIRKNAVLRTDHGTVPIALGDDSVAVGDVLQQTGNLPLQGQSISIVCRFQGHPPLANANLFDRVHHGDVITVSDKGRTTLKGFGRMAPAFSEWKSEPKVQGTQVSLPVSDPEMTKPNSDLQFPGSPSLPHDFSIPGLEPAEPVEGFPGLQPAVRGNVPGLAVQGVSQAVPVPDAAMPMEAPEPPVEIPIVNESAEEQTANAPGTWNIVFVAVLLISGLLILAGSLRPEQENDVMTPESAEKALSIEEGRAPVVSVPFLPMASLSDTGRRTAQVTSDSRIATEHATVPMRKHMGAEKSLIDVTTHQVASASAGLVSAHEWFGDDWRNNTVATSVRPLNSAVATAAPIQTPVDAPSVTRTVAENSPKPVTSLPSLEIQPDVKMPAAGQGRADILQSQAGAMTEGTATSENSEAFTELDDLLQNRLPVDLCTARLPMRISLFGRAAGPRRLRIDAAHTKLSGPHINLAAERKREEPAMAPAIDIPAERHSMGEIGSLDRALHNLQDRNDL